MSLVCTSAMSSALAAVLLLAGATPVAAQAAPLGNGGGVILGQDQEIQLFAFHCLQLPDGSITGVVVIAEPATRGFLRVELSSATAFGDMLAVAGEITAAVNTPPQFGVGQTMFLVFDDNGHGRTAPDQLARGVVPLAFGNPTIQQILALVGPPPPSAFTPVLRGDIRIR